MNDDLISRRTVIDARRYTFGNDEFSLEDAYHDCKLVFDGITDDDSFQEADTGLILYYANEIIYALQEALEGKDTNVHSSCSESPNNSTLQPTCNQLATDCISRQAAIDALIEWYGCEPNDIDAFKEIIYNKPSAQPEREKGKWKETDDGWDGTYYVCSECGCPWTLIDGTPFDNGMNYCPNCGAKMEVEG